ncbi:metallophosphoesterase family protein [Psychrobacillus sp. INOP01]|uniref:metallophosphoesterase family protein n=1 Tax=Psychrobacillus sp. INOP01 TaxID=2829187 RepID=UPI001BA85D47|nr:metallophosphoesterase family protein [Psychrobacillus sp. INOP01]QUG40331.1 metallophosphoesterase family protein [Psychrobacillus sp. INOP01]
MKVAIITDIHGNELALQAVLKEIDATEDVQEIWCLGDMIAMGPDTNEVLDTLFERSDIQMITGNHDEAILSLILGEGHPDSYKHTREHHEWIANQLSLQNVKRLQQLPRIIKKEIKDIRLFGIHYHIEQHLLEAHIKEEPFYTILEPTLENTISMFGAYPADIICFGHNHPEHLFQTDNKILLNPGALGVSKGNTAPYAIIDFAFVKPEVTIHHVAYDKVAFLQKFETLQVPQREILFKLFYTE